MKRRFFLRVFAVFAAFFLMVGIVSLPSCGDDEPKPNSDTVITDPDKPDTGDTSTFVPSDATYPRTQIIEHFTGEGCQNCPDGISGIEEFIDKMSDYKFIWVAHHYYTHDNFKFDGTMNLISWLHPDMSVPACLVNRATWRVNNKNTKAFHPGYIAQISNQLKSTTSTATISLKNTFEATQKKLNIEVSGKSSIQPNLSLTIWIKENGLHGYQESNKYSFFSGWTDYIHANVTRAFVTNVRGDDLMLNSNDFTRTYSFDWKDEWVAENSMVVVILVDKETQEILNAVEMPVVAGTTGGADLPHGGDTIPLPNPYWPEQNDYPYKNQTINFDMAAKYYRLGETDEFKAISLALYSNDIPSIRGKATTPAADLILFIPKDATTLPVGEYPFSATDAVNTAAQGDRYYKYATYLFTGSFIVMALNSDLEYNLIDYETSPSWFCKEGSVTVTENSITVSATSWNGTVMNGVFNGTAENLDATAAQALRAKSIKRRLGLTKK